MFRTAFFVVAVAVGTLSWTATAAAAPANDGFANAEALAGPAGTVSSTTIGATSQPGEQCAIETWGCGASVWYTWQTPATTTTPMSFATCALDAFDTTLQVYTGNSFATLELVAEDDGACGLGSRVDFAAVPGTTYSIRVGGYGPRTGNFQLRYCEGAPWSPEAPGLVCVTPPPPNIDTLIGSVEALGLPSTLEGGLLKKLNVAQTKLEIGKVAAACKNLAAFIDRVNAQRGKRIATADADALIDEARGVRESVGC